MYKTVTSLHRYFELQVALRIVENYTAIAIVCWNKEELPAQWIESIIVPAQNKCDKT